MQAFSLAALSEYDEPDVRINNCFCSFHEIHSALFRAQPAGGGYYLRLRIKTIPRPKTSSRGLNLCFAKINLIDCVCYQMGFAGKKTLSCQLRALTFRQPDHRRTKWQ